MFARIRIRDVLGANRRAYATRRCRQYRCAHTHVAISNDSMTGRRHHRTSSLLLAVAAVIGGLVALGILTHRDHLRDEKRVTAPVMSDTVTSTLPRAVETTRQRADHNGPSMNAMTSAPLAPSGAPLAKTYEELKARADAGDVDAATRLFHEARHCANARQALRDTSRQARWLLEENNEGLDAEALKLHEQRLADAQKALADAEAANNSCAGLADAQLMLAPMGFRAAQLGDIDTGRCYVSGTLLLGSAGLLEHPEWLTQYRQSALQIAQAMIERGDWRTVGMLQTAYDSATAWGLLGHLTGADRAMSYRYAKLRQLGAGGKDQEDFDAKLAQSAQGLTTEQVARADSWAEDAYRRFFRESGPSDDPVNNMIICSETNVEFR